MNIQIRPYDEADFAILDRCMVELQTYLTQIDPLHRIRVGPNYSPKYAKDVLERVREWDGAIFLAFDGDRAVGCVAGNIEVQTEVNVEEGIPTRPGRIIELYVAEEYRGQGIGRQLIERIEQYLKEKGCDVIRIEVFAPNADARQVY